MEAAKSVDAGRSCRHLVAEPVDDGCGSYTISSVRGSYDPDSVGSEDGNTVRKTERSNNAEAAPATVSGEHLSTKATGANRFGKARIDATTRKPGDLPF